MKQAGKGVLSLAMKGAWAVLSFCLVLSWAGMIVAAPLELFVSIPPQKYLVDQLGGDLVESHVLVGQGQSPHLFHPTSRQMMALARAKLFFTMDMEFEHILLAKLQQSASSLKIINSVRSIPKISMDTHRHGDSSHVSKDPHVWLSPLNLKTMAAIMARELIAADSVNQGIYKRNLIKLNDELERLDSTIQKELAPFAGASFYVFHPSFGYFANRYNLRQEAVEWGGKAPTPRQLSALIAKAKKEHVKVIFVQAQFDSRSGVAMARAIGGEVVPLNPLAENVTENLELMAAHIKAALQR